MEIIKYYQVTECYDRDIKVIGNFRNRVDAQTVKLEKNSDYRSIQEMNLVIHDSYISYKEYENGELRKKALQKLTSEEMHVLGLKDS